MPFINTHTGAPQGEKICLYTPNNKGFIRLPKRPAGAKKIGAILKKLRPPRVVGGGGGWSEIGTYTQDISVGGPLC